MNRVSPNVTVRNRLVVAICVVLVAILAAPLTATALDIQICVSEPDGPEVCYPDSCVQGNIMGCINGLKQQAEGEVESTIDDIARELQPTADWAEECIDNPDHPAAYCALASKYLGFVIWTATEALQGRVYHCGVEYGVRATDTVTTTQTVYGFEAYGNSYCNEPVGLLGITIKFNGQGWGGCLGAPVLHELLNEPHQIWDTRDEIIETANDPQRAQCLRTEYARSLVCSSRCMSATATEISFSLSVPDEITHVDTTEPDRCHVSPFDNFTVECHFYNVPGYRVP